ncbi:unnamed protein product [Arctia plantaginis]|uniref:C-type lectin domain-containing protein n=1 Tax=Arctia plantaginis TaxID=874455 RepID=A0A8S1BCQ5_ARCPL|nr:unnamed protein product [Arctia plantaginis]
MCKIKTVLKYLLVALELGFLEGSRFRCDYMSTNVGWFKYHEVPLNFHDAYLQCKYEGAMLASPSTAEIKSVMMELMCNADILTGIHSTFAKGQFHSIDGIPLAQIYHEWAPFEPDNKNNAESCIASNYKGKLSDVSCDEPRPFICHKKHINIDPNDCGTTDPDYRYDKRTNKCYKLHNKPKRFAPAFFTCSAEGGHLAIINSEKELKVIHELHALYPPNKIAGHYDKNSAFLGFYYEEDVADWTTIHGKTLEEAGFAKFQEGQPSNSTTGEYCGAVYRDSFFNDVSCHKRFAFICEKSPHYPEICDSENLERQANYTRICRRNFEDKGKSSPGKTNNPVY